MPANIHTICECISHICILYICFSLSWARNWNWNWNFFISTVTPLTLKKYSTFTFLSSKANCVAACMFSVSPWSSSSSSSSSSLLALYHAHKFMWDTYHLSSNHFSLRFHMDKHEHVGFARFCASIYIHIHTCIYTTTLSRRPLYNVNLFHLYYFITTQIN